MKKLFTVFHHYFLHVVQVKSMGLFNPDTMSLDGVLLRVVKVDMKSNYYYLEVERHC
ncbi:hypothetical protein J2T15_006261 [Paenibacillus harenae]|uniref:Transposase n=1 Tax=Paenibacillus harenae TaxID=306543 RepID=A0ABT9UEC0_PAEHA|nr:hypothetical protein [Paenibacillus harenae]